MALRNIRHDEDEILRKQSKLVKVFDDRLKELADDMIETMNNTEGVGLAAVQVGILKQMIVIDIGEGPMVFVNPDIIETEGSCDDYEGCLSVPGYSGVVERPEKLKMKYQDLEGNEHELETEGFLTRVICHETDHLKGILYTDKAKEMYTNEELKAKLDKEQKKKEAK